MEILHRSRRSPIVGRLLAIPDYRTPGVSEAQNIGFRGHRSLGRLESLEFSKYINILDCFHIYAEPAISDQKVLHAASIVAELLDNNEDGIVDDPLLEHQLRNSQAMMPLFSSEWSSAMDDVWNYYRF